MSLLQTNTVDLGYPSPHHEPILCNETATSQAVAACPTPWRIQLIGRIVRKRIARLVLESHLAAFLMLTSSELTSTATFSLDRTILKNGHSCKLTRSLRFMQWSPSES